MHVVHALVLAVYYASLTLLVCYGAHRLWLTWLYVKRGEEPCADPGDTPLPRVTVQLPMYNERLVAERLIRAAGELDYPRDLLQIQVLDDSSDDTRDVVDRVAAELARDGRDIDVVRRTDRRGYKAGALEHGLASAKGALVAVFDADFVPPPGFLRDTVGHFASPDVGMVQVRWGHLNRDSSLLTRAQAALLDGHFVVEQTARSRDGRFFNFNGTAGVWRRRAIEEAGGWEHDTITEDLDLSYRAQLAGWRFVYRTDIVAPAELPAELVGLRSQQHRWAKGSIECLRKLGRRILTADVPRRTRFEALVHLTANLSYPLLLVVALTMPLVSRIRQIQEPAFAVYADLVLLALGFGSLSAFYFVSQRRQGCGLVEALLCIPLIVGLDIGLCVHKSRAVCEALVGHRSAFIRTPKLALTRRDRVPILDPYVSRQLTAGLVEGVVGAWLCFGIAEVLAGPHPSMIALPFLVLFATGFAFVTAVAIRQAVPKAASVAGLLPRAEAQRT